MELGLAGKAALVTGGSKGIGYAVAARLLREGADVAICARDEVGLKAAAVSLEGPGTGRVVATRADVASAKDIASFVESANDAFGKIDIVVINPGHPPTSFESDFGYTDDNWSSGFEQLVLSTVRLCRLTVPAMAERGWGRVALITTLFGREPSPDHVLSGALRVCSHWLLKSLATEWAPKGVTMNAVLPGAIDTPRARQTAAVAVSKGLQEPAKSIRIPIGRMGTPEEVADTVAFLCSEPAGYITGAGLPVDGGVLRTI